MVDKAMIQFASQNNGLPPLPGLAGRTALNSQDPEDFSANHSATFYSYMIAMNLLRSEQLISPSEVNPAVRVKEDYNYNAYQPAQGSFWDPTFAVRIDDPKVGSNVSFAHASGCGQFASDTAWRDANSSSLAIIGTRGPRDGATSGPEFDRSPTLRFHDPKNQWVGSIVFKDHHAETLNTFVIAMKHDAGQSFNDNFFKPDRADTRGNRLTSDSFLGLFIGSSEFTVDPIYDPLD
jgi:hypothetical protein